MKTTKKANQFLNNLKTVLLKKNLVQPNESLLLAISGGQDSIFLLISIYILKNQWRINLTLFYCNHLWQENSLTSYLYLSKISYCLKINFFYSISLKNINSEEQGHYWRSKNFYRLIIFSKTIKILTGHTLTDNIETFFFNTIRGSSFKGSSSLKIKKIYSKNKKNDFLITNYQLTNYFTIKKKSFFFYSKVKKKMKLKKYFYKNKKKKVELKLKNKYSFIIKNKIFVQLVRPLLQKTRFDTKNFCKLWKLPLFIDETNDKKIYSRNRLRKQIFPILRFFFNPKVDLSLYRYNEIILEEEKFIEKLIKIFIENLLYEDENTYYINISILYSLPLPYRRRICLIFFQEKFQIQYSFTQINFFLNFLNQKPKNGSKINMKSKNFLSFFFPELGIIYFSKTGCILLK